MADDKILKFYKHSNDKGEIGWENSNDINAIGPNLQGLFKVLRGQGLREIAHVYQKEHGWSVVIGQSVY